MELAIPGLYVSVLKLVGNQNLALNIGLSQWITFLFWLVALVLSLVALFPRRYDVDTNVLSGNNLRNGAMGVADYFHRSARYKRRFVDRIQSVFLCRHRRHRIINALIEVSDEHKTKTHFQMRQS